MTYSDLKVRAPIVLDASSVASKGLPANSVYSPTKELGPDVGRWQQNDDNGRGP
jgi:hypothetical protein